MATYTERARALRPYIVKAAENLSDTDAAKAVELFAAWTYPVSYAVGDRRSDGGKLYKCRIPRRKIGSPAPRLHFGL